MNYLPRDEKGRFISRKYATLTADRVRQTKIVVELDFANVVFRADNKEIVFSREEIVKILNSFKNHK